MQQLVPVKRHQHVHDLDNADRAVADEDRDQDELDEPETHHAEGHQVEDFERVLRDDRGRGGCGGLGVSHFHITRSAWGTCSKQD